MNVFIPGLKTANLFFDEIILYSKCNFILDYFKKYKTNYKTVLIHWPEQIFNWKEPTDEGLQQLKESIKLWKQNSKIVYVVHNLERHYGMTPNFIQLYELIESSCDEMIHLGSYSKSLMENKFPLKLHHIIFHPLYKNSFKVNNKKKARNQLDIDTKAFLILVPGVIRNKAEIELVFKAFNDLKIPKKLLLVTRMYKKKYNFKGRWFLKKYFNIDVQKIHDKFWDYVYNKRGYYVNYNFLETEKFSLMLSASDVVFIPRKDILNSGNVFLAMTFQKIMIGPDRGNISEVLKKIKMPLFNPESSVSVKNALQEAIDLYNSDSYKYDSNILTEYSPFVLAQQWDAILSK